jgi:predicted transposase YdaD
MPFGGDMKRGREKGLNVREKGEERGKEKGRKEGKKEKIGRKRVK